MNWLTANRRPRPWSVVKTALEPLRPYPFLSFMKLEFTSRHPKH